MSAKIVRRINALLAQASDGSVTDAERQAFLDKADALMLQHRIDEALLRQAESDSSGVTKIEWDIPYTGFFNDISAIVGAICAYNNLQGCYTSRKFFVVGFPSDINYAQQIWLIIFREFTARMNPSWSKSASFDENVYAFKSAGYTWMDITAEAVEAGAMEKADDGGRALRAYRRECKRRGVEPIKRQNRHDAYRNSYARSFAATISMRLRDRWIKSQKETVADSDRYALALRSDADKVREAFYNFFPDLRPMTDEQREAARAREQAEWESLSDEEKAKRKRQQEKAERAFEEMQRKRYDGMGWDAGAEAASKVDLSLGENRLADEKTGIER